MDNLANPLITIIEIEIIVDCALSKSAKTPRHCRMTHGGRVGEGEEKPNKVEIRVGRV